MCGEIVAKKSARMLRALCLRTAAQPLDCILNHQKLLALFLHSRAGFSAATYLQCVPLVRRPDVVLREREPLLQALRLLRMACACSAWA